MTPIFIDNLSKLSKVFHTAIPHVFVVALRRFNLGRFNKHTVHSLIQAINKILNGTYEQLSNHSICPLRFTVNHWKLLSECRFQPDLCHDFSQGILALMNVMWDNVRSLSDIEEGWKMVNVTAIPEKVPRSEELQTVTLKSVLSKLETLASNCSGYVLRAMWAMKTVAEAITEALVTSLEALGRQRPCPTTSTTPGFRPEQDFTCSTQQRSQYVPADLRSKADTRPQKGMRIPECCLLQQQYLGKSSVQAGLPVLPPSGEAS
ncbi:uncharacterized protein ACIBXB_002804 isoform 2-T11 [Morphnus guianensis]